MSPAPAGPVRLRWINACAGIGALVAVLAIVGLAVTGDTKRLWSTLLLGAMLPVWLGIGALGFIALHVIVGARWVLPIRRVLEGLTAMLPVGALAIVAALCGGAALYDWWSPDVRKLLFHTESKQAWMQPARWLTTMMVILIVWQVVRTALLRPGWRGQALSRRTAIITLLVLAPTFTLFAWDALLALQAQFTSAMWGIYCMTGALHAALGATAILLFAFRAPLSGTVRDHTRHDLGTWLVAFSCIVAYIAFAQYVVIWYANLDEESQFLLLRSQHGYGAVAIVGFALRCLVPFALLMSQRLRTQPAAQLAAGVAILAGTWIDLAWIVVPWFSPGEHRCLLAPAELGVGLGALGVALFLAGRFWARHGVVANDPDLPAVVRAEHLH